VAATHSSDTTASDASPQSLQVATTQTIDLSQVKMRREHDLLGERDIPSDAYWGVHTLRAVENFPITGVPVGHFSNFVRALVYVKQAAARANRRLGYLAPEKADAIEKACQLIGNEGKHHDQFVVDAVQGGAGTSTNMNTNEVVANVALEVMGRPKGDYAALHPNDDVNMSQSTNDAYPTALRLAVIFAAEPLIEALDELADAFFVTIKEDVSRIREAAALFREVNLGATAIGTGINADPRYAALAIEELARMSKQPLVPASNLIEATSDMGAFVLFSGVLKRVAVKLSKICNDLRLLSSGPRAGLAEIKLPAVQAGSSIMPGKVNPVIPEVVNQVAFIVIGHDLTVTMCAEGGQLQLNAFEPTIGYCLLASLRQLTAAITTLTTRCVNGIEADRERCRTLVEDSIGLVTALGPTLGYETSSRVAKRALNEKRKVADIVLEEGLLTREQLDDLLKLEAMTAPSRARPGRTG
jgi:aspartate ammonia-lyase